MWSVIHTCTPLSLHHFPPLPLAHIRVPLSSHHPLYSKHPASFPLLLSPGTVRHLASHSIMLVLDAFSASHFTHIRFPPFPPPPPPIAIEAHVKFPIPIFPPNFSSLSWTSLFIPCCSSPLSLWSLTYLFGADIVVFMRAASPAAAEGRPHNLALVAALGLFR